MFWLKSTNNCDN